MDTRLPTLRVIALYISQAKETPSVAVAEMQLRPGFGVVGDRHVGATRVRSTGEVVPNLRHFTAIAPQDLGVVAERLGVPYIDPLWLGANLCLASDDITQLTVALVAGTQLLDSQGQAILQVEGVTEPCLEAGAIVAAQFPHLAIQAQAFPKTAYGRRGVYGIVFAEATIRVGDILHAQAPAG